MSELFSLLAQPEFNPKGLQNLESLVLENWSSSGDFNNESMKSFFEKLTSLKNLTVGFMFKLPKQMRLQIAQAVAELITARSNSLISCDFSRFSRSQDGGDKEGEVIVNALNTEKSGPKKLETMICPGNEAWWTESTLKLFREKSISKQENLQTVDMRFSKLEENDVGLMLGCIRDGESEKMKNFYLYDGNKCTSDTAKKCTFDLRVKGVTVTGV